MNVLYLKPAERIVSYVQAILVIERGQMMGPFSLPLFANGTPTLLFSTTPGQIGTNTYQLTLFGQTVLPEQILFPHDFRLVAYFLKPFALGSLFNISANELTDRPLDLQLLAGMPGLQEQLLNAATTGQLIQIIDDYLFAHINACNNDDKRLAHAAQRIAGNPDKNILRAVQQELHLTERTFERLFEKHIGVSPNLFRRIIQFEKAFRQLNHNQFADLSTVAHQNYYADQSHFIRAFKEFTKLTPSQYLENSRGIV